jgi:hypothetical protein
LQFLAVLLQQCEAGGSAVGEPPLQRVRQHLVALVLGCLLEQVAHDELSQADLEGCGVVDEQTAAALFGAGDEASAFLRALKVALRGL